MTSPSPSYAVVARYQSLDDLFRAIDAGAVPGHADGGWVCVHPRTLPEPYLARYLATRERVHALGWRLVVTRTVGPHAVELRRHRRGPDVRGETAVPAPGVTAERSDGTGGSPGSAALSRRRPEASRREMKSPLTRAAKAALTFLALLASRRSRYFSNHPCTSPHQRRWS